MEPAIFTVGFVAGMLIAGGAAQHDASSVVIGLTFLALGVVFMFN